MRALMFILILSVMSPAWAKDKGGSYAAAEDAYRQGDFEEAIHIYLSAIQDGEQSASLFYNLGTSLYKNGELGSAVAALLRARSLDPSDPDIRYNLRFLQEKTRDKLDTKLPQDRLSEWSASHWFTERALFWWMSIALVLMFSLVAWMLFSGKASLLSWIGAFILLIGALYPGLSLARVLWQAPDWGAVRTAEVDVLASPTVRNAVVIFQLHEGAPFAVTNESGDWYKIQLSDGKSGWVPREHLAIFGKNFFSYQTSKNETSPEKPTL
jgi:tetratricopeptide (TPR) repeat protein